MIPDASALTSPVRKSCPLVLIIEDEACGVRLIHTRLLEGDAQVFSVRHAGSLSAAQHLIAVEGLRPDVVLLDLNLPDSSGIATIERCRSLIEAPILVLSSLDDPLAIEAAIQAGAEDALDKNSDAATLRKAIHTALLRYRRDSDARLSATVFTHAREGIVITTADARIIDVNNAFSRITGYRRSEVLGQNPRIFSSGRHNPEFYVALWRSLSEKGHWNGELWNRRKNGEVYVEMKTISVVHDAQGNIQHYVALFSDITPLKAYQKQLERIAHYDALTTLPNRVLLADRMRQAMVQAQRRKQRLAVAYLDFDDFKAINDTHGHDTGDHLLIALAARMKQALREGDTLARLGGDEFIAVLLDLENITACGPVLCRLLAAAAQPVHIGNLVLQVSASVGVTFYPQTAGAEADQLLRQADQAMYQAKLAGKNRYHVFDAE